MNNESAIMAVIDVGSDAPDFSFLNQDGAAVTLAEFSGKRILMWWYPRADTPG